MNNTVPTEDKKIQQIDQFQQGLTMDAKVRYLFVDATTLIRTAIEKHKLRTLSATLCAEGVLASILMSSQIKGEERLTVQLESNDPSCRMLCDINSEGGVRVKWIPANLDEQSNNHLTGVLVTIKHNRERELYRGVTEINDESITSALAHHLNQSSQIDCLLRTSVLFQNGTLEKAIGILLEKYPESEENPSATKEEFLADYHSLHTMSNADFLIQMSKSTMCGHPLFSLESKDLHWFCSCSDERIDTMLMSIGKEELMVILEEMDAIETRCEYCNTLYHRDHSDVERLFPTA